MPTPFLVYRRTAANALPGRINTEQCAAAVVLQIVKLQVYFRELCTRAAAKMRMCMWRVACIHEQRTEHINVYATYNMANEQ